ncbi:DDE-type integrase/transposase/recombinase [Ruegeria sp. SCP11]|uniref:DDE-type integrase/transposase/recombinase n=1 Tax=Ruegeria sp. SCP11 TaxID=3141378 RepID=UPI003A97C7DD
MSCQSTNCQVKIPKNLAKQDHRFFKRRVTHMRGFKAFRSAAAAQDGIEVANMNRKHQFPCTEVAEISSSRTS